MRAFLVVAVLLMAARATADDASAAEARAAEERAFAAVEKEQWCDALAFFLEANRLAPTPDMLFNAAHAADLGDDRARAVQLYTELLGTAPVARKSEAKKKLAALMKTVEKQGSGTACPPPSAPLAAAAEPPPSTSGPAGTAPATPPPAATGGAPLWALGSLGAGGVTSVAGTALLVVGALPWFSYAGAQEQLRTAEAAGSLDVDAAVDAQATAARDWEGFGRISVGTGAALLGVGVLALAAGAAGLALTEPAEQGSSE